MKKIVLSLVLVLILCLSVAPAALADSSGTIGITATGASEIAITIAPGSWELGYVAEGGSEETSSLYTLTNTGNVEVDTTIEATDFTGAGDYTWTLAGTADSDICVLKHLISGGSDVVITTSATSFVEDLPAGTGNTKDFNLKFTPPTTITQGGVPMSSTVTIAAVAS